MRGRFLSRAGAAMGWAEGEGGATAKVDIGIVERYCIKDVGQLEWASGQVAQTIKQVGVESAKIV